MDAESTMTVPPPLPTKSQARDRSQAGRQSVSIRTASPATSPITSVSCRSSSEKVGATVFVSGSAPASDSTATCRNSPEVQSPNDNEDERRNQQQQQNHNHNRAAHVVKIKINPNGNTSKVISTVRLNLDSNSGQDVQDNNFTQGQSEDEERKSVVVASSTSSNGFANDKSAGSDGCVRISVVTGKEFDRQVKEEMVQRGDQDSLSGSFNGNRSSCFYYNSFPNSLAGMVMSSGQCSPSDTLDSGTGSDLDGTPPPLPKKKNSNTVVLGNGHHNRTGSLTSSGAEVDSDDNESNVSCDSLNNGDLERLRTGNGNFEQKETSEITEVNAKLKAVRLAGNGAKTNGCISSSSSFYLNEESPCASPGSSLSKASSTPRVQSPEVLEIQRRSSTDSPIVKECTYEERQQEKEVESGEFYSNYNRGTEGKYIYEDDRFYKFHLNECRNEQDSAKSNDAKNEESDDGECFAGVKILEKDAIRSAKGTVRGVKNRVRAGIATFLQKPSVKDYRSKDAGKIVVYTTTMGIVRETYYACMKVKQILRTHLVKYEERDLYMSAESQVELKDRIGCTTVHVPQLFIDGLHIGNADTVERLNESGELRPMLKPYQSADACNTCATCGGYRLFPCPVCNGSKKSIHRNDFTAEFIALKCMNCDEVGLVRCQNC